MFLNFNLNFAMITLKFSQKALFVAWAPFARTHSFITKSINIAASSSISFLYGPHWWVFSSTSPVVINLLEYFSTLFLLLKGQTPQHCLILETCSHTTLQHISPEKALGIMTSMLLRQQSLGVNHEATQTMLDKLWLR